MQSFNQLNDRLMQKQQRLQNLLLLSSLIQAQYTKQNLAWANILLHGEDTDAYHRHLSDFYRHERLTLENVAQLEGLLQENSSLKLLIGTYKNDLYKLRAKYREALRLYNSTAEPRQATDNFLATITELPTRELNQFETALRRYYNEAIGALHKSAQENERITLMFTIILFIFLTIVLLWVIDRNFAKPMASAVSAAKKVASGNLDTQIEITCEGEFKEFSQTFNFMVHNLKESTQKLETSIDELRKEITLREQVENSLRKEQQALALANQQLETFNYTVSHDLRTPLRAIAGFSSIVNDENREQLSVAGRDYLDRIRKAAARMGELIDELLGLSRVNKVMLNLVPVNLSALADEINNELAAADPDRHVERKIEPGLVVTGDSKLLYAAMSNLLGNAWKFTRRQNNATIEFGSYNDEKGVVYFVRDNGVGFDKQQAGRLFQAFQRLHPESEYEGSGIGLATVERIIHRHGGRVWAESEPGTGASFFFTLN